MTIQNTIKNRLEKAKLKALPLIEKYKKMSINEKLIYLKENKSIWKKEHNIINRYYNLFAYEQGIILK
jgi:hypothetical protein